MKNYELIIFISLAIFGSIYFYKMMYILNKKNIQMNSIFVLIDVPSKFNNLVIKYKDKPIYKRLKKIYNVYYFIIILVSLFFIYLFLMMTYRY
jgi:hypothetical protein